MGGCAANDGWAAIGLGFHSTNDTVGGDLVQRKTDDGTLEPWWWNADRSDYHCMSYSDVQLL